MMNISSTSHSFESFISFNEIRSMLSRKNNESLMLNYILCMQDYISVDATTHFFSLYEFVIAYELKIYLVAPISKTE